MNWNDSLEETPPILFHPCKTKRQTHSRHTPSSPSILQVGLLRRHSVLFSHTSCVFRGIKGLPTTQSRVQFFSLFFSNKGKRERLTELRPSVVVVIVVVVIRYDQLAMAKTPSCLLLIASHQFGVPSTGELGRGTDNVPTVSRYSATLPAKAP